MKPLRRTQFGNPILRTVTKRLSKAQILSDPVQHLIEQMWITLERKHYGVGLAAPQVNYDLALSVIGIKPTPSRPNVEFISIVIINPSITEYYGDPEPMWEGCISFGGVQNFPYAQVPRYGKIHLEWEDEQAQIHEADLDGILAHVIQHEVDHLNGILFVDRVEDSTSYMTISEYKRRYVSKE